MTRFLLRLSDDQDEAAAAEAKRLGVSKADVLRLALDEYLPDRSTRVPARQQEPADAAA